LGVSKAKPLQKIAKVEAVLVEGVALIGADKGKARAVNLKVSACLEGVAGVEDEFFGGGWEGEVVVEEGVAGGVGEFGPGGGVLAGGDAAHERRAGDKAVGGVSGLDADIDSTETGTDGGRIEEGVEGLAAGDRRSGESGRAAEDALALGRWRWGRSGRPWGWTEKTR
jgi:hypothetical protein